MGKQLRYDKSLDLDIVCTNRDGVGELIARSGIVQPDKMRGPGTKLQLAEEGRVVFDIPPLFGSGYVGRFVVQWEAQGPNEIRVWSQLVSSRTRQTKLLFLVPLGPKKALAERPYGKAVSQIRSELNR